MLYIEILCRDKALELATLISRAVPFPEENLIMPGLLKVMCDAIGKYRSGQWDSKTFMANISYVHRSIEVFDGYHQSYKEDFSKLYPAYARSLTLMMLTGAIEDFEPFLNENGVFTVFDIHGIDMMADTLRNFIFRDLETGVEADKVIEVVGEAVQSLKEKLSKVYC